MLLRRTTALLATVGLAAATFLAPGSPAVAAVTSGAVFNNPTVAGQQYAVVEHLQALIRGAATGSTIRVAIYHFSLTRVSDDLIAAHDRGVNVRVVVDSESRDYPAVTSLTGRLGSNRANPSWVTVCTSGRACIGDLGTPIMHNKFFLFSNTSGSTNVLVQSSANLTNANAERYWNNAVTLVGNTAVYDAYAAYHSDLAAQVKNNDYYRTTSSGNAKSYFFPRAGTTQDTDTIYNMLDENVTCEGNTSTGTETGRTIIRIGMWYFSRNPIATKLRELADRKCWVEVVYTDSDADVPAILSGHDRIRLYRISGDYIVHSKYMLIEGTYAGQRDTKWVMTGSHNYSNAALRENDEALLRIQSATIHDQYRSNFWALRDAAVPVS
ncbi:phospholipase D-like domain-containing protein [Micromonospora cathayae]|uniref:phospholipase D n=1 Tax=Micromonospora cathayae TaxID=3028804 RepID=A0ABY7ZLE4_9ACTN|nr:phosphatidylserine/phosphatidylglycerophosphate/cardiolipin synthase family protein [Micromonospora sp. HUAS 3]WDZ83770.1 phosphatidylserine/phosphatidylglycerophosphate/cardiolipin synthase family protein [Micromonospora sp. HUAS 3]